MGVSRGNKDFLIALDASLSSLEPGSVHVVYLHFVFDHPRRRLKVGSRAAGKRRSLILSLPRISRERARATFCNGATEAEIHSFSLFGRPPLGRPGRARRENTPSRLHRHTRRRDATHAIRCAMRCDARIGHVFFFSFHPHTHTYIR